MIYLDYAATTPVNEEVLKTFYDISKSYIGNPNSTHKLGQEAKSCLDLSTKKIAEILKVKESEIIYTSGATEANNLAIKGIANEYKRYGKHIISTYLEHSSVTGPLTALQNQGFEIDYVDVLDNGLVDLEHLKELLREDTILVSIGYVDSEVGIKQDINEIGKILLSYPNCFFHVDATQAIGKIPVSFENIDLISFAPHKFYGLNGIGILIKKENVLLEPLIHGGISTTIFRSGTPNLALIASAEKAISLANMDIENKYQYVKNLNQRLQQSLKEYSKVRINSTDKSIPYILNISIKGISTTNFQKELENYDIYVSTKSACCAPNTPSRPVYAITKDRKLALSTLRISLSHYTTMEDIDTFLDCFDKCYKKLVK
ncbi:cysteine desulfurase family protein [Defluviitalea phaphyphila]|uniref:cysteine desulfurase family protein n=1 Tax=Defluviitalea phaphyphila TaxID=1473580 RepID=UPI0007305122|nr:cysteine desulfurase family protein [Defluviitalea phaphyphila]